LALLDSVVVDDDDDDNVVARRKPQITARLRILPLSVPQPIDLAFIDSASQSVTKKLLSICEAVVKT
jgi:hypothetical protein